MRSLCAWAIGPLKSPCEGAFWTSVWKSACKRRLKRSLEEAAVKKPAERRFLTRFLDEAFGLRLFQEHFRRDCMKGSISRGFFEDTVYGLDGL